MIRRAFTLIEMMIVVLLMAIVAVVVLPNASADGTVRLVSAVNMIVADIEYAQSLSLAEPSDPALVRIDEAAESYWIARASDPATPVNRPNGEPYVVTYGTDPGVDLLGVTLDLENEAKDIQYDEFGRLSTVGERVILVTSAICGTMRIRVKAETGSVYIDPDAS